MATTNIELENLIAELRQQAEKTGAPIWKRLASDLEKPTRRRREANLSRISRFLKDGETAVVPGKVLGSGELKGPATIAAWQFSAAAMEKIKKAKGTPMGIAEFCRKNPKGAGARIIG